jgi:prophage regulatory protein
MRRNNSAFRFAWMISPQRGHGAPRIKWGKVMTDERILLDLREVSKLLGISPRAIWGWADAGTFPPPLELGRLRRWRRVDIESWLARQAAAAKGGDHEPR